MARVYWITILAVHFNGLYRYQRLSGLSILQLLIVFSVATYYSKSIEFLNKSSIDTMTSMYWITILALHFNALYRYQCLSGLWILQLPRAIKVETYYSKSIEFRNNRSIDMIRRRLCNNSFSSFQRIISISVSISLMNIRPIPPLHHYLNIRKSHSYNPKWPSIHLHSHKSDY